jgi:dihydroorotate dehydrogenase
VVSDESAPRPVAGATGTWFDALGRGVTRVAGFLPPEDAHMLALGGLERMATLGLLPARPAVCDDYRLVTQLGPLMLPNPLGLAAGWDKDGRAIPGVLSLGFGFTEVGTVTPLPQVGNPRPRVFRLRADRALINRMGFPNHGVAELARRLRQLEVSETSVVGVNIGKGRETPLENAAADYVACLDALPIERVHFLVINVSSPNTPGLRGLQEAGPLAQLVGAVVAAAARHAEAGGLSATPPVFVKLAPDAADEMLVLAAEAAVGAGAAGLIAVNTTVARPGHLRSGPSLVAETGGLSGAPLAERARAVVARLREALGPTVPIVGIGGITSPEDAWEMLRAGADAVQVMSWFTFPDGGPSLAARVCAHLIQRVEAVGAPTLAAALGRS